MYPTSHLLATTLIDERLRESEKDRRAKAAADLAPEGAPRWWRIRASQGRAAVAAVDRPRCLAKPASVLEGR